MTDHREDIRESADRWTDYARWAMMADRDELPHAFATTDDDERPDYRLCDECREYADHECHDVPDGFAPDEYSDGLAGLLLDVDALTSADGDRWRVELILAVGGPTVWVVVDSRWSSVEFHHSWGCEIADDDSGEIDRHEIDLWGDDADVWREVAMMAAGVDA